MTTALENLSNTITLTEINWPVFQLTSRTPITENGVTYYITESYNKDNNTYKENKRIIDDKNIKEPTLSRRRLRLEVQKANLYKIKKAIYFIGDFIKLASPKTWFIDSSGRVFQYKKTTRAKLRFYKVKNIFPVAGIGAVVEVHGLPQRFKVLFRPVDHNMWAGVLEINGLHFMYGIYDQQYKETWRLV